MKTLLLTILLAPASLSAQAADYFLPNAECDGSANIRSEPNTHSRILAVLNYASPQHKILGSQGRWFRIQLDGNRTGYVHQSQGFIVQNYIVASPDGSANVRSIDPWYPAGRAPVIKTLPNGTRVQIVPSLSKGSWLLYDNQGAYTEKDEYGNDAVFQGYIHKSQLRRID
ncbi:SH3 domain-containing protein [Eikenella sp. S3360]|uniref:SH3 domain-containing protein n=1 Tax=Eikenella glucosivorans TaxID=2766967 RepID=A0ABS0NDM4_9NEIS|nr:SH3 domain-containing protein [Eikenella glucosivorans]MBH5330356.1 SH3 domain-containing protein [Eikenella glucosivorans]